MRFATFNSALSREAPGELLAAMRTPDDEQAKAVATIIQATRPDVLLLQEFDHGGGYDPDGEALRLFQQNYLAMPQASGLTAIAYEHVYLAPSNTGLPTGVDLNNDGLIAPTAGAEVGTRAYAADCHGWGKFPGQYAFVVLSKYPIDRDGIRTFQEFLWKDLPGNHLRPIVRGLEDEREPRPSGRGSGGEPDPSLTVGARKAPEPYYPPEAWDVLRLSSKNHVDVPIDVGGKTIHLLAAHPTPPVFDGPEDRNGRRNFDEIKLMSTMLPKGTWQDCTGEVHTMVPEYLGPPVVVAGDLNADPIDGDSFSLAAPVQQDLAAWCLTPDMAAMLLTEASSPIDWQGSIAQLLTDYRFSRELVPLSKGGDAAATMQGGGNTAHRGHATADTADWDDVRGPGNLRVDYVLPSNDLTVVDSGVFWPTPDEPLMGVDLATVERASDHRLVWVDVEVE